MIKIPFLTLVSSQMIYEKAPYVKWNIVEGNMVLVDTREMELLRFNEVASAVWDQMDGQRKIEEIVNHVAEQFEAPLPQIQKDVAAFVRKLLERELILEKNA